MSRYVASYDVSDDRRRDRVARVLSGYGERVQRSVFEIWLEPEEVPLLKREVGPLLARTDLFHLFPIDERGTRTTVAWQQSLPEREPVIIVG